MSWISDVKADLAGLDLSQKSLRHFGWLVGSILLLLGLFFYYKEFSFILVVTVLMSGLLLLLFSFIAPGRLQGIYEIWMALAFLMGWLVSRILLSVIFFLLLAPIGLMAKVFGKQFLAIKIDSRQDSYWLKKEKSETNYKKMY